MHGALTVVPCPSAKCMSLDSLRMKWCVITPVLEFGVFNCLISPRCTRSVVNGNLDARSWLVHVHRADLCIFHSSSHLTSAWRGLFTTVVETRLGFAEHCFNQVLFLVNAICLWLMRCTHGRTAPTLIGVPQLNIHSLTSFGHIKLISWEIVAIVISPLSAKLSGTG